MPYGILPSMDESIPSRVTQILGEIESGNAAATEQLFPLVYDELRRMAQVQMNGESPDHTLQATALVHEVYLKLVGRLVPVRWESRGHFFIVAADAMRKLLVDHARARLAQKRGGDLNRAALPTQVADYRLSPQQMLEFNEALDRLAGRDRVKAEVVKLRCFTGLGREQISNSLGVSLATVDRHWAFAKVWLYQQLHKGIADE